MCKLFKVSRSSYYAWKHRGITSHEQHDRHLTERIKHSYGKNREVRGARAILSDLKDEGIKTSRRRICRIMKENNLGRVVKRKFVVTTDSSHNLPVAKNLLNREFKVSHPNKVYVSDITYIRTSEEDWLYLAVFIDLYSRAVVGWAMSEKIDAELVNKAFIMAIQTRSPEEGLIVHSDRGSQYASDLFQRTLKKNKFVCSMSRKGTAETMLWLRASLLQ